MPFKRKNGISQATRVVALSFGGVILVGTLLLLLPISSSSGASCGLMTALFTATSSTCVTGLLMVDTLTAWSPFGQAVILLMVQLGGLGFMTMIFFFGLMVRGKTSISGRLLMVSSFNLNDMGDTAQVVRHALRLTLVMEGGGAVILAACFAPRYGWGALWKGLFTSVSAFCNGGFDLMGPEGAGSLTSYQDNPAVLLTVSVLVVSGGLGFFVWEELLQKRSYRKLSLYSKMVLWLSGGLLVFGTVFYFCAEYSNGETLGPMPLWQKGLNAFFQSVTVRTSGFAAVEQGALRDVSLVMSIVMMVIGGSSGSTAGGVKTVTVGVLLLSLREGLRGQDEVVFRGRTIPQRKVLAALTLVLALGVLIVAFSMAIAILDGVPYLAAIFESAAALTTVGLTTGITAGLSTVTRLLLLAAMYLGRVGVLSFSLAFLHGDGARRKISYPETDVMIG